MTIGAWRSASSPTAAPVASVAAAVGYSTPSAFSAELGFPPARFLR